MKRKRSPRVALRIISTFLLVALFTGVLIADRPGNLNSLSSQFPFQPRPLAPGGVSRATSALGSAGPANPGGANEAAAGPVIGQAVMIDVSRPLSEIPAGSLEPADHIREMGIPGESELIAADLIYPQIEDPALQASFSGDVKNSVQYHIPSLLQNFPGISNLSGVYPPDPNGDVGKNHYVQMVNLKLQIWDKTGKSLLGPIDSNAIWSGSGAPCATTNDGDPVVLYDQLADRWILSQFTASNPYGECVAISTTANPTGSYYRYFFKFSATVMYDYPKLGVWPDGYYLTANRFSTGFAGASAIALERSQMLVGQTARFIEFKTSYSYSSLLPADLDGSTLPPANSPNFLLSMGSSSLQLWKFRTNWGNPGSSTFSGPTLVPIALFNPLCIGARSCIDQPDTSAKLDGIGDRLMHRLVYRNFGDHETLLVSHSVNVAASGTRAGVRWYEMRSPNGAPEIYQQGSYAPDGAHRWMPSIAIDRVGNIAVVYSISSSSIYPGIRYAGRLTSDPLGQLTQTENTLISGSGSQTGTGSRWGDYAMISVDPVDGCTFWMTSEYIPYTGTAPWRTQVGSFAFSGCINLGSMMGVIRDQTTNQPLGGAIVEAQPSGGNLPPYQAVSSDSGEYHIDYLPAGTYTVKASFVLHKPAQISGVAVQVGATSTQDLALEPDPGTILFAPYFSKNFQR